MNCILCSQPLDGDTVEFGLFDAHRGCAQDWAHENAWVEREREDELERQEG